MVIIWEKLEKAHQTSAPGCEGSEACCKLQNPQNCFYIDSKINFLAQERFGQGEFNKLELNSKSYILSKTFRIWCEI